ncbi:hypothetical protein BC828DRAFT_417209 [Blastocladiella britannica]|nr:hypothetical protein BC828DRAFT_417209 [Blastocladiella britannica]
MVVVMVTAAIATAITATSLNDLTCLADAYLITTPAPRCECYDMCGASTSGIPCCRDSVAFHAHLAQFARRHHLPSARPDDHHMIDQRRMIAVTVWQVISDPLSARLHAAACLFERCARFPGWTLERDGCLDQPVAIVVVYGNGTMEVGVPGPGDGWNPAALFFP